MNIRTSDELLDNYVIIESNYTCTVIVEKYYYC